MHYYLGMSKLCGHVECSLRGLVLLMIQLYICSINYTQLHDWYIL